MAGRNIYISRAMQKAFAVIQNKIKGEVGLAEMTEAALHYASNNLLDDKATVEKFGTGNDTFYNIKDTSAPRYIQEEILPEVLEDTPAGAVIPKKTTVIASPDDYTFSIDDDGKHALDSMHTNYEYDRSRLINQALAFAYSEGAVFKRFMDAE